MSRQSKRPSTTDGKAGPGTSPSGAQRRLSQQRAEAARARIAAAQRRKRLQIVGAVVGTIVVVIAVFVGVKLATDAGAPKSGAVRSSASTSVLGEVTSVPAATLDAVGAGAITTPPTAISASALTSAGKPEILYVGAEYCPYCAAERWAVVVALSRFGTFAGLGQTASSPSDVFPSTQTLTFHGSTYTSNYLVFDGKETVSNQVVNGKYSTLDVLTSAEQSVVSKYDAPPYLSSGGAIPFIDIGGKYLISGSSFSPQVLQKLSHAQIAGALASSTSPVAQAIDGTANVITAAVCQLTGGKPASVCSSAGVTAAAAKLSASG